MVKMKTKEIICYIIKKLKSQSTFFGKLQLMKLMFLVEHLDINTDKLVRKGFLGNEFIIYYLGPFSFEISKIYDELNPKEIETSVIELSPEVKQRVDKLIERYGNKDGLELQKICMEKLGISPVEKNKYFGLSVKKILK
jgi:hypothetical protein